LISQVGQHVLVESGLLDICSCATPVLPELGGEGMRKKPSLRPSTVPSRSTHTLVRDNRCSSRQSSHPSLVFLPPSGAGQKRRPKPQAVSGWRSRLREFFHVPGSSPSVFQHLSDRVGAVRTLPRWFALFGGSLYEQCAVAVTQGTLLEAVYR
jgi:hypothetical protein